MANTTVKGKFNVVAENGDVQTIYPKTTGDQVIVDRSSNSSVIPNDVANLQHIVNKMGSLAFKSKVETSDFTTGTMIGVAGTGDDPCANLKANTDAGKIADALIVKNIESRVDTLENSNLVTVDELETGLATKPDTEINDSVTSTSLTWSSKKLSDQLTTLNSNTSVLISRVNNIIAHNNDTENNSELIDIRTGDNGIVYSSAGSAFRNRMADTNDNIKSFSQNRTVSIELPGEIVDFRYDTSNKSSSAANDTHGSKRFNVQNVSLVRVSMYTLLAINAVTFIDSNDQVLSYIRLATDFSSSDMVYENIVVPENAVYMVCSNNPSNSANIRAYEIVDDLTSKRTVSINDFSLDKAYTTSGILTGDSTWKHTDFIPLENVLSISSMLGYFSGIAAIAFFDSTKNFVSGITPQHTTTSAVTAYIPKVTVFPENAEYVVFSTRVSISDSNYVYFEYQNMTISEIIETLGNKADKQDFSGLKFACFGDSITSDEVTGIGTKINRLLGTQLVGNFAHGNATCSDWYNAQNGNITTETPNVDHKDNNPTKTALSQNQNVLSNQVRRCLAYTTAANSNVTYHHQIDGDFILNTSIWTGTGSTENTPDIIYIAVGINDGQTNNLTVDDTDTVFAQEYSQLDRCGFASSLRWAIETLLSAYPDAQFFVASPLQTGGTYTRINYQNTLLKRNIVQKVCQYCSVNFIDSFSESGYNRMLSYGIASWDTDTVHPKPVWANRIAHYVAQKIRERYLMILS